MWRVRGSSRQRKRNPGSCRSASRVRQPPRVRGVDGLEQLATGDWRLSMKRVAIVGGGISGLSAAFYLEKARGNGSDISYTLYEAGSRLGGVLRSERVEGCLI